MSPKCRQEDNLFMNSKALYGLNNFHFFCFENLLLRSFVLKQTIKLCFQNNNNYKYMFKQFFCLKNKN